MYAGQSRNITLVSIGNPRSRSVADYPADPEGGDGGGDTRLGSPDEELPALLDQLEESGGPADPVPSTDGWELVLAENVAYLVDDQRRWQALAALRQVVGLDPEQILAAPEAVLRGVAAGARPAERAERQIGRCRLPVRLGAARTRRCSRLARLVAAVEYLVVGRALVEVGEYRLGLGGHVREVVILAHERLHRVQRVEPHQGHELHVAIPFAADQVDRPEPGDAPCLDARDDLAPYDALVRLGILRGSPASPQTADHDPRLSLGTAAGLAGIRTPKPVAASFSSTGPGAIKAATLAALSSSSWARTFL
jgi:hypothetical protein